MAGRTRRRLAIGGAALVGVVIGAVVVLGVEVVVAGNGPHVTEFDPHLADGVIDAPSDASGPPLRVVWLGDSTAAGVGASQPAQGVARQVARRLHRGIDLHVFAVSGARVAEVRASQVPHVAEVDDVDLVLVSIGANDSTHQTGTADFHRDYDAVVAALPARAAVVLLGVPDLGSPTRLAQPLRWLAGTYGSTYDTVVRDVAADHGAAYVDIAKMTGSRFRDDPDRYFAADHYHPSDAGYDVWADAIVPVVDWKLFTREHPDQPVPPVPEEGR